MVSHLVESNASRRTLLARATDGSLPLHSVMRYQAPEAMVLTLLGGDEGHCTLLEPDAHGQIPLHAACRNGARLEVINMLLRRNGGMLMVMRVLLTKLTFVPPLPSIRHPSEMHLVAIVV